MSAIIFLIKTNVVFHHFSVSWRLPKWWDTWIRKWWPKGCFQNSSYSLWDYIHCQARRCLPENNHWSFVSTLFNRKHLVHEKILSSWWIWLFWYAITFLYHTLEKERAMYFERRNHSCLLTTDKSWYFAWPCPIINLLWPENVFHYIEIACQGLSCWHNIFLKTCFAFQVILVIFTLECLPSPTDHAK